MQGKPGKGKSSACSSSIQAEADGTTGPSTVQGEAHTDAQPYVRQMAAPGPANPHARGGRWGLAWQSLWWGKEHWQHMSWLSQVPCPVEPYVRWGRRQPSSVPCLPTQETHTRFGPAEPWVRGGSWDGETIPDLIKMRDAAPGPPETYLRWGKQFLANGLGSLPLPPFFHIPFGPGRLPIPLFLFGAEPGWARRRFFFFFAPICPRSQSRSEVKTEERRMKKSALSLCFGERWAIYEESK